MVRAVLEMGGLSRESAEELEVWTMSFFQFRKTCISTQIRYKYSLILFEHHFPFLQISTFNLLTSGSHRLRKKPGPPLNRCEKIFAVVVNAH